MAKQINGKRPILDELLKRLDDYRKFPFLDLKSGRLASPAGNSVWRNACPALKGPLSQALPMIAPGLCCSAAHGGRSGRIAGSAGYVGMCLEQLQPGKSGAEAQTAAMPWPYSSNPVT